MERAQVGKRKSTETEPTGDNVGLIPVQFSESERPEDLCLKCLESSRRSQRKDPVVRVAVVGITLLILVCFLSQSGVYSLYQTWFPFLGLLDVEDEFSIVGILATLSIALAITCGHIIQGQNREAKRIRKQVVQWDSWGDVNRLNAIFGMNAAGLGLVCLLVVCRLAALIAHAPDLSPALWLAVVIYVVLLLVAAVDIVRLRVSLKTATLHDRIRQALDVEQWKTIEKLAEETKSIERLPSWMLSLGAALLGGIVAGIVFFTGTPANLQTKVTIVVVCVFLCLVFLWAQRSMISLSLDTLVMRRPSSRRISIIARCIALGAWWTLVIAVCLLPVGPLQDNVHVFDTPILTVIILVEWVISLVWLCLVAVGASGRGPLRGLAGPLAKAAIQVGEQEWPPPKMPRGLRKQAERVYRDLHPGEWYRFRQCSTDGCLNNFGLQSEEDPSASSSEETDVNPPQPPSDLGELTPKSQARTVLEGLRMRATPGIEFRDGPTGRQAALVDGPDVWEVITALRLSERAGEEAVRKVAADLLLRVKAVETAISYYSKFPDEVDKRIAFAEEQAASARAASEEGQSASWPISAEADDPAMFVKLAQEQVALRSGQIGS